MKSQLYRKYRRSKQKFPTRHIQGTGSVKGKVIPGSQPALEDIERQLGRKLVVSKTDHTIGEWVFCERK
jgi:hypothetical protein